MFLFWEHPIGLLLMLVSAVLAGAAQLGVHRAYNKYAKVPTRGNRTGAEVAADIVAGTDVRVTRSSHGHLSDHYDPRSNTIALSNEVYDGTSVAALGIAAHEAGHALQHSSGYVPITLRNGILPLARLGSMASMPLIIAGIFFGVGFEWLINLGIVFFITTLAFQLVTLPVEFNASSRAVRILCADGYLQPDELAGAKAVLRAAAMTYVAAIAVAILQLIRLLLMANRRR
ncbi:MAG: zinc metallopeptidase [Oscillospiraceae bacterium]|nr:zinc metallopeptidase [Oscillospiraceae bacterium]